jgi:hypothetical protein
MLGWVRGNNIGSTCSKVALRSFFLSHLGTCFDDKIRDVTVFLVSVICTEISRVC